MKNKKRPTLLIVDDSDYNRLLFKRTMAPMGFDVLEARNGIEGEKVYEEFREEIGLITLDVTMPEQDGITTLANIRKKDQDVPVMMFTGATQKEVLVRCARLGIIGFFPSR